MNFMSNKLETGIGSPMRTFLIIFLGSYVFTMRHVLF